MLRLEVEPEVDVISAIYVIEKLSPVAEREVTCDPLVPNEVVKAPWRFVSQGRA
jgi:hypothetical protein